MSLFSRLFGGGGTKPDEVETYNEFRIFAEPVREGSVYRLAARIEKDVDGVTQEHKLIRADTFQNAGEAADASRAKARQMIDEQGDRLFG